MRIVHIFPHLRPGGAERVVVHIMTHMDRSRFDVSGICLASRCNSDLEHLVDQAGIPVQFLGKGPGFHPLMYVRMHRALRSCAPDVIHTHAHVLRYLSPYLAYSRLLWTGVPVIHTIHNVAEYEVEPRARWLQGFAFRHQVTPIAVAEEVSRSVSKLYGVETPAVIPNCLPLDRYRNPSLDKDRWRAQEGFDSRWLLLTCVAGLRPQKNHSLLLQAFAEVASLEGRAHLVLAGGGDQTELRCRAASLGIARRVHFLGVRSDIPDLLGASDIFVLASNYEGNPLCILEAMTAGLPVVAPQVGGVSEVLTNGSEGFLFPAGSLQSLVSALLMLLRDSALRTALGAAGVRRALQRFDVSSMVSAYQELYAAAARPLLSPVRAGVPLF